MVIYSAQCFMSSDWMIYQRRGRGEHGGKLLIVSFKIFAICLILMQVCIVFSAGSTDLLDQMLEDYDKQLRPNEYGEPCVVGVKLRINSIGPISEEDMNFRVDIFLRWYWIDPRLVYNSTQVSRLNVNQDYQAKLWKPDLYIVNELEIYGHELPSPNMFFWLYDTGYIIFSRRLSVILRCNMDLQFFPVDTQSCLITFESYGYKTHDLIVSWEDDDNPVEIPEDLQVTQFQLLSHIATYHNNTYSTGSFSGLTVEFRLARFLSYYIIAFYLPVNLIVIISWVSFWINCTYVPARAGLGVTTVLTVVTLMLTASSTSPKISYIKVLDVYFIICFLYVFMALIEFAVVCYTGYTSTKRITDHLPVKSDEDLITTHVDDPSSVSDQYVQRYRLSFPRRLDLSSLSNGAISTRGRNAKNYTCSSLRINNKRRFIPRLTYLKNMKATRIDELSRILFPVTYVMINVVYWVILVTMS